MGSEGAVTAERSSASGNVSLSILRLWIDGCARPTGIREENCLLSKRLHKPEGEEDVLQPLKHPFDQGHFFNAQPITLQDPLECLHRTVQEARLEDDILGKGIDGVQASMNQLLRPQVNGLLQQSVMCTKREGTDRKTHTLRDVYQGEDARVGVFMQLPGLNSKT